MCGIAGILHAPGRPVKELELRAMASALAHRGPDDEGMHLDGNLGLANRRLAILDPSSAGHQPMSNEDGSVWVTYNGQLYDFADLRSWLEGRGHRFRSRTDTEIIVHLYEEKGDELLADIDGMFAFGLWDANRRRLLLARDRLGIKPLYYLTHGTSFAFASELKALTAVPGFPREADTTALVHFLYQSSVPGDFCALKGYRKLAPGSLLSVESEATRGRAYWALPEERPPAAESFGEAATALGERLSAAVRSHLVADVPVGTFLSGGLDSTAVTQAATPLLDPVHTFSVRFRDDPGADEGPAAREVAEALGTRHRELLLGPDCLDALPDLVGAADEPFAVSSGLALHHLARFARSHVKVVLTGDGADEILGGYPWRHGPSRPRRVALAAVRALRGARAGLVPFLPGLAGWLPRDRAESYAAVASGFTLRELTSLLSADLAAEAGRAWEANPVRLTYERLPAGDEVNRRLRADLTTTLVDEMLTKVDRFTMAAGLEARVPFLDRRLVEWAFRQPGWYKVAGGTGKLLLRKALASTLPAAATRAKHGFDVPLGRWFRGPLRGRLLDTLSADAIRRRGLLRPDAVDRLLRAHLAGRADYSRKLFSILVLETWLERLQHARWTSGDPPAASPGGRAGASEVTALHLASGRG
jgi:asparagine synthase (glutamine-hydrolysing)